MGQESRPGTDVTLSLLSIEPDCPWCLNATIETLEADPHVSRVTAHSADGCLEVVHRGSVDAVLCTIQSTGRTIEVASNGEAVMAPATARIESACRHHSAPSITLTRSDVLT